MQTDSAHAKARNIFLNTLAFTLGREDESEAVFSGMLVTDSARDV